MTGGILLMVFLKHLSCRWLEGFCSVYVWSTWAVVNRTAVWGDEDDFVWSTACHRSCALYKLLCKLNIDTALLCIVCICRAGLATMCLASRQQQQDHTQTCIRQKKLSPRSQKLNCHTMCQTIRQKAIKYWLNLSSNNKGWGGGASS